MKLNPESPDLMQKFSEFVREWFDIPPCREQIDHFPSDFEKTDESGSPCFPLLPSDISEFYILDDEWELIPDTSQDHLFWVPLEFPNGGCGIPPGRGHLCFLSENQGSWVVSASKSTGDWECYCSNESYSNWIPISASPSHLLVTFALQEIVGSGQVLSEWHRKHHKDLRGFEGVYQEDAERLLGQHRSSTHMLFEGLFEPWSIQFDTPPEKPRFFVNEPAGLLWQGDENSWENATYKGARAPYRDATTRRGRSTA